MLYAENRFGGAENQLGVLPWYRYHRSVSEAKNEVKELKNASISALRI
jgi:hypothetical protein